MRTIIVVCIAVLLLNSCKKKTEEQPGIVKEISKIEYTSFGNKIIADDAIKASSMATHYQAMTIGDSINSKIMAKVINVCQAKGCWMTLSLGDDQEVMVKFKDYGFFVPKDISGKDVIINGKAFVKEVSVDEQRHYAEDAGKSKDEIASITEVKRTYSFEADGVLLKQ